jgi:AraC family transcriptional regulator
MSGLICRMPRYDSAHAMAPVARLRETIIRRSSCTVAHERLIDSTIGRSRHMPYSPPAAEPSMDTFEATTTASAHVIADVTEMPRAVLRPERSAYTGWRTTRAGMVEVKAAAEHRIRILASDQPVGGDCGTKRFVYTRGDMDIMPAEYADTWREDADNTSLYVALAPRLLHRTAEDLGIDSQRVVLEHRHQFRDSHIEHIAWALDAERRSGYANGSLYVESLGTALAVHLLHRYRGSALRPQGLPAAALGRLKDYIEANLDQSLSLADLGEVAGVSSSHLKTLFRRSTGMPVHQYVMRRRVERARDLLSHGSLPVSQIALDVGFSHQSHMARCMQRLLGVTPSALRRAGKA